MEFGLAQKFGLERRCWLPRTATQHKDCNSSVFLIFDISCTACWQGHGGWTWTGLDLAAPSRTVLLLTLGILFIPQIDTPFIFTSHIPS